MRIGISSMASGLRLNGYMSSNCTSLNVALFILMVNHQFCSKPKYKTKRLQPVYDKDTRHVFGSSNIFLYYKVYNSSCTQVGHDLIDRVKSSPEQIQITVSIYKHILCYDGSAACYEIDASMQ